MKAKTVRWSAITLAFGMVACMPEPAAVEQPFSFNHTIHVERQGIPCTDCHPGAESEVHAGLPSLSRCLICHMKPQGDKPSVREQEVRKMAASGFKLFWKQVTRNPGHVYVSHRAHVGVAKLPCEGCHGNVADWLTPPTMPIADLIDMDSCLACHRKSGASPNCRSCHK